MDTVMATVTIMATVMIMGTVNTMAMGTGQVALGFAAALFVLGFVAVPVLGFFYTAPADSRAWRRPP